MKRSRNLLESPEEQAEKSIKTENSEPIREQDKVVTISETVEIIDDEVHEYKHVRINSGPFQGKVILKPVNRKAIVLSLDRLAGPTKMKLAFGIAPNRFGVDWKGSSEFYSFDGETTGITASKFANKGKADLVCFVKPDHGRFAILSRLENHLEELGFTICEKIKKSFKLNSILKGLPELESHQVKCKVGYDTKEGKYDTRIFLDGERVDYTDLIKDTGKELTHYKVRTTFKISNPYFMEGFKDSHIDITAGLSLNFVRMDFTTIVKAPELMEEVNDEVDFVFEETY